jgi:TonB family protein
MKDHVNFSTQNHEINSLPLNKVANDRFAHFLTVSLSIHLGFVAIMLLKSLIFPIEPIVFQPAIHVDLLGLPDKLPDEIDISKKPSPKARPEPPSRPQPGTPIPPPPAPSIRPATQPTLPTAPSVNLDQTRRNQSQALNRIEQMAALEKLKQQQEQALAVARVQENLRQQIRGDTVSEGTSLRGVARLEYEQYLSRIEAQIRRAWTLPPWLANKNLKAKAIVKLNHDGSLLSAEVIEPSGDLMFDDLILDTIRRVTPFSAPPENIASVLRARGIVFGFPE